MPTCVSLFTAIEHSKMLNSKEKKGRGKPLICTLFSTQLIEQPNEFAISTGLGQGLLFGILSLEDKGSSTNNSLIWKVICYKA